jgi:hypothetical protein
MRILKYIKIFFILLFGINCFSQRISLPDTLIIHIKENDTTIGHTISDSSKIIEIVSHINSMDKFTSSLIVDNVNDWKYKLCSTNYEIYIYDYQMIFDNTSFIIRKKDIKKLGKLITFK